MMNNTSQQKVWTIAVVCLVVGGLFGFYAGWYWQQGKIEELKSLKVFKVENGEIWVLARVNGKYFDETTQYGLTYEWGSNSGKSLFPAKANPRSVYEALIDLGYEPDLSLTLESPDGTLVNGPLIEVYVTWEGADRRFKYEEVVLDPEGRGVEIHFGGNITYSDDLRTGCIICLWSCPVAIVSNAKYGWKAVPEYQLNRNILPPDGTPVYVILVPKG